MTSRKDAAKKFDHHFYNKWIKYLSDVQQFISSNCDTSSHLECSFNNLMTVYNSWARTNHKLELSNTEFAGCLSKLGYPRKPKLKLSSQTKRLGIDIITIC